MTNLLPDGGFTANLHDWSTSLMPITVPEPIAPLVPAAMEYGLTAREAADLIPDTPIFQSLIRDVAARQIEHEEQQLREWLRALIENPAGRKLIEEML